MSLPFLRSRRDSSLATVIIASNLSLFCPSRFFFSLLLWCGVLTSPSLKSFLRKLRGLTPSFRFVRAPQCTVFACEGICVGAPSLFMTNTDTASLQGYPFFLGGAPSRLLS